MLVEADQIDKLREIDEKVRDDEMIHEVSESQADKQESSGVKEKKEVKFDLNQLKVQYAVGINTRNVEKLEDFVEKATSSEDLYVLIVFKRFVKFFYRFYRLYKELVKKI